MGHVATASNDQQQAAWKAKQLPDVELVRPGLWSIPIPIPLGSLRYVLVYALELADGVAIIDAGWNTDEAYTALEAGLGVAGFELTDVRAVLITHIHPDHYGLAGRVREVSGAWIGMHPADAELVHDRYADEAVGALVKREYQILVACGVPTGTADELATASLVLRALVDQGKPDRLIEHGELVDLPGWDLRALWTPGHSPGHLCFTSAQRRLLFTGDHLLPRITPIVSLHAQSPPNPLADYRRSLRLIRELDVAEVLPAHEYRFAALAERVDAVLAHHDERLAEIEGLAAGSTCWEITIRLTWSRPWDQIPFFMQRAANGETLAHLVWLADRGRVRRDPGEPERWTRV